MMTLKTSVVLILAYVLALAAGTTSGILADRLRAPTGPNAPLAAQLQLSPTQSEQIRGVWEAVSRDMDTCTQQAQAIQQARDQALYAVLTDQQKAEFAAKDKDFADQFAELLTKRQAAFDAGVKSTEEMLNPDQRLAYDRVIRERLGNALPLSGSSTQPSVDAVRP